MPSPIGKFRASSSKKIERNKRGHRSPSLATGKLRAPSAEIVEKGEREAIAITNRRQVLSSELKDN